MKKQHLLSFIILLIFILVLRPHNSLAQGLPKICLEQPENILRNCTFDNGLEYWQTFTQQGAANFSVLQGGGECHAPLCPAAYIVVDDHFVGGLYQQVPASIGNNYYANVTWLTFDSLSNDAGIHQATGGIGRRIGIDPLGGTDPNSPNIVWSPDNWRNDCKTCDIEQVTVTAQADTITVFLRLDDTWKLRAADQGFSVPPSKDKFWIDEIGLKPVGGEAILPADTPAPPTNTPIPATNTPTLPANTPMPEIEPTVDQTTEISQITQTANLTTTDVAAAITVTETETTLVEPVSPVTTPSTNTPVPAPPTLTPSATPSSTSTPQAPPSPSPTSYQSRRITPEAARSNLPLVLSTAGTTACAGGLILILIAIVMAGLVWLYRLGWGGSDDDDYDDEFDVAPSSIEPDDDPVEQLAPDDGKNNDKDKDKDKDKDNDKEVTDNVEP